MVAEAQRVHPGLAYYTGPSGQEGSLIHQLSDKQRINTWPIAVIFTQLFPWLVYSTNPQQREKLLCALYMWIVLPSSSAHECHVLIQSMLTQVLLTARVS